MDPPAPHSYPSILLRIETATLASIESAAVPGAGMMMLVIVLGAIGVPKAGLALFFAVDRVLDMCRTVLKITGNAAVSMIMARALVSFANQMSMTWNDD